MSMNDDLRAWARGVYALEAGVELLIRQGRAIYDGAPWIIDEGRTVWVDAEVLLQRTGAYSAGERRLITIAASLMGVGSVDLSDAVTSLDRRNLGLVLAALSHANGSQDDADWGQHGLQRFGPLFRWPAAFNSEG